MTQALYFVVSAIAQLVILAFLLRFWLPVLRVDFRNPVAQAILRITSPLVVPVRRVLPPLGRVDTATVVVLLALQLVAIVVLLAIRGILPGDGPGPLALLLAAVAELGIHSLWLFFIVVLVSVVLSWVAPHNYNPVVAAVDTMAQPLLRPFRRIVPAIGGIDISPVFALILLQAAIILLESIAPFRV